MDLLIEVAKAQATLNNLIEASRRQEEGKCEVDILGSLLVLQDQLKKVDEAAEEIN